MTERKIRACVSGSFTKFKDIIDLTIFLYVVNPEGYVGETVSMEIGFAVALGIPVFLQNKLSSLLYLDERWKEIEPELKVCTVQETIISVKNYIKNSF